MSFWIGLAALAAALVALLYLFLILPRLSGGADLEFLRVNYAHRGLWDAQAPENSLSAFSRAIRAGYGIELDVQLSKDGRVMVFHDDSLKRMCGVNRRLCEMTYAELKGLRLKGTEQTIPTLDEVLSLVRGRVPLMIEFKGERPNPALCLCAARRLDLYGGPFSVISFNPLILRWFKLFRPGYARGQLVTKIKKGERSPRRAVAFLLSHMLLNCFSRPDFISVNGAIRNRPVFLLCHRLLRVCGFVWTVRTNREHLRAKKKGWYSVFESIRPNSNERKHTP